MKKYHDIRREYGNETLDESNVQANPLEQFKKWFEQVLAIESDDPTAMVLATVDEYNVPDTRVVLLKELAEDGFVFYTNYLSDKGKQIEHNPHAAINFYWAKCVRQVTIRGEIVKLSRDHAEAYFASRPIGSQVSAHASIQSAVIIERHVLEEKMAKLTKQFEGQQVPCPDYWGGYKLIPTEIEFFQGRDSRLHDRLRYRLVEGNWIIERLSP